MLRFLAQAKNPFSETAKALLEAGTDKARAVALSSEALWEA